MGQALDGLAQLRECVDSVIAIPNDRLLQLGGPQHPGLRGLPRRRRRAAPGGAGHHRHHHRARPDQPRLRRRARGDEGHGPGGHGHGHRPGREPRGRGGAARDLEPAPRGHLDRGRPGHHRQHHRRGRPVAWPRPRRRRRSSRRWPIPRPTSSTASSPTRRWATRSRSRSSPPASTAAPRKVAPTPVDLANYMSTPPAPAAPAARAADAGGFYRKTPNAKAASGGGGRFGPGRSRLPAAQGRRRAEANSHGLLRTRAAAAAECGQEYRVRGRLAPGCGDRGPRALLLHVRRLVVETFLPGSVNRSGWC